MSLAFYIIFSLYSTHYSKWAIDMGLVVSNVAHLAMATHEEKERTKKTAPRALEPKTYP
jgi:hypothetical protein